MKKTPQKNLFKIINSYLDRKYGEQEIPNGFYPKDYYYKKLECSPKMFYKLTVKLKKVNAIESVFIKRHFKGRISKMAFYRIKPKILSTLNIKI